MAKKEEIVAEATRVFDEEIKALESAKRFIGVNYYKAAEALVSAKKVIVSGIGKSGLIGRKIAATLTSIGIPAVFMHSVDALHGDIGIVEKGDVAVLLSKSGSTKELVELVPFLKSRSAYIIAITSDGKSYLNRTSDITLNAHVEYEACPLNIVPTSSSTLSLVIGDALAICVMKLKGIKIEDFIRQHPLGQIGRNNTLQIRDVMHKENALPIVRLGASFKEAIIEMSAKGLGCVGIVDENCNLSGIITDGDIRRILQKQGDIRGLIVDELMTSSPVSIVGDALLGDALSLMENRKSQLSALPVIDESNKYVGLIRVHDIIRSGL